MIAHDGSATYDGDAVRRRRARKRAIMTRRVKIDVVEVLMLVVVLSRG